jgi:hypothetical protein
VSENALSRIPFRVRDELVIVSMARWMRFIGVVKVVIGLLTGFLLLVAVISLGSELGSGPPTGTGSGAGAPSATVTVGLDGRTVSLGTVRRLVAENQTTFFILGLFGLLLAVAGTLLGFVLYTAADDFERVARSDVADQDYITAGVMQLNTYFKVSILLAVATVLVGISAAMSLAVKIQAGS